VTAADDSWSSGLMATGKSYSHTFAAPGTYPYICRVHPYMLGSIVVD
jgi:plastocyanin